MGIKQDQITKTWSVSYSKRPPGLNQQPVSLRRTKIKTEREAKRVYADLVLAVQRRIEASAIPTWRALNLEFHDFNRKRGITEKTISSQEYCLAAHTYEKWGLRLVNSITTAEVLSLHNERVGQAAQGHQQYFLRCVKQVFQYALESGFILRNPVPQKKFRVGDKIKKALSEDQARSLLNKARALDHAWYPHWAFAIYTGMRNGELFALTWDKVDLERNQILINTSWNSKDGYKATKSGDDRLIEIAPGLMPVVKELKLQSLGMDFVLPRVSRWDQGEQARELRMFLVGIGLPPVRFHDLRATWATLLLSKGVEPIKVMKMGGWKDMKTMMIYIRKAGVDIKGATQCLDLHDGVRREGEVLRFKEM